MSFHLRIGRSCKKYSCNRSILYLDIDSVIMVLMIWFNIISAIANSKEFGSLFIAMVVCLKYTIEIPMNIRITGFMKLQLVAVFIYLTLLENIYVYFNKAELISLISYSSCVNIAYTLWLFFSFSIRLVINYREIQELPQRSELVSQRMDWKNYPNELSALVEEERVRDSISAEFQRIDRLLEKLTPSFGHELPEFSVSAIRNRYMKKNEKFDEIKRKERPIEMLKTTINRRMRTKVSRERRPSIQYKTKML